MASVIVWLWLSRSSWRGSEGGGGEEEREREGGDDFFITSSPFFTWTLTGSHLFLPGRGERKERNIDSKTVAYVGPLYKC